jgi:hypothetical protein
MCNYGKSHSPKNAKNLVGQVNISHILNPNITN